MSYLCNAYDFKHPYLLLDYVAIFAICTSYLNNFMINGALFSMIVFEGIHQRSIVKSKNVAFVVATIKCGINTYYYVDRLHYAVFTMSSLTGVVINQVRYHLINANNHKYTLFLTSIMHACATCIMFVSSITTI